MRFIHPPFKNTPLCYPLRDPSIKLQSVLETEIFATIEIEERSHVVRRPYLGVYYTSDDVVSVSSHVSAESAVGFRGSWRKSKPRARKKEDSNTKRAKGFGA